MPSAPVSESSPRRPVWFARPRVLDVGSVITSVLAGSVEVINLIVKGAPFAGYLGIAAVLAGVALSRKWKWTGLTVTLVGVLVSALVVNPLAEWTIAVFTVFSVTLRGLPAVRAGALVAFGTFAASFYAEAIGLANSLPAVGVEAIGPANTMAYIAFFSSISSAAAGSALRSHQQYLLSLEQRALDAFATRETEANRRVAEERLRIARDLHDVMGHEVAAISMHLGAAEVSLPQGSEAAKSALASARTGVQSVLRETQRILELLRSEDDATDLSPVPDASQLPALVDSYRSIGMEVDVTGELPPISDAVVSGAVYRVVQEALTNAHRHGRGPVLLSYAVQDRSLVIEARNAKGPVSADEADRRGFGLVGIRERATGLGGDAVVVADDATFTLTVTLRLDGGAAL